LIFAALTTIVIQQASECAKQECSRFASAGLSLSSDVLIMGSDRACISVQRSKPNWSVALSNGSGRLSSLKAGVACEFDIMMFDNVSTIWLSQ